MKINSGRQDSRRHFDEQLRTRLAKLTGGTVHTTILNNKSGYSVTAIYGDVSMSADIHNFSQETGKAVFEKFKQEIGEQNEHKFRITNNTDMDSHPDNNIYNT
jgi:hypothetical protein